MSDDYEFVVIEGIDGAGKTDLSKYLSENYGYHYLAQPENTWVGEAARKAQNEDVAPLCDLFLHMAAHANQQKRLTSLVNTKNVVMDRYYHSRVAYQSVQTRFSAKEIEELHFDWSVRPPKVIILDISPKIALERKDGSKDKFEEEEFLSKVRQVYIDYFGKRDNVIILDGHKSREEIRQIVKCEVLK